MKGCILVYHKDSFVMKVKLSSKHRGRIVLRSDEINYCYKIRQNKENQIMNVNYHTVEDFYRV